MDWFTKAFLKASLSWLALGVSLGVAMAVYPPLARYRTAHLHMNLLGFVSMMISGVAYHVIPRFTGHPLHSRGLAGIHWWIANTGLVVFVLGFMASANGLASAGLLLAGGGTASALGAYAFVYNIWRTIDGRPVTPGSNGLRLPVADRA